MQPTDVEIIGVLLPLGLLLKPHCGAVINFSLSVHHDGDELVVLVVVLVVVLLSIGFYRVLHLAVKTVVGIRIQLNRLCFELLLLFGFLLGDASRLSQVRLEHSVAILFLVIEQTRLPAGAAGGAGCADLPRQKVGGNVCMCVRAERVYVALLVRHLLQRFRQPALQNGVDSLLELEALAAQTSSGVVGPEVGEDALQVCHKLLLLLLRQHHACSVRGSCIGLLLVGAWDSAVLAEHTEQVAYPR
mmetsp:Transcript_7687/g.14589  ORF Transcript_7687/g.14589 Transcript_7687/m.14589 type:complete len:245 (+) Transcript_7687:461-1195(+)